MIKFFSDISDDDLLIVGGKGMSLAKMTNADFPVPPGFVVTTRAFWKDKYSREQEVLSAFDQLDCEYVAVRSSGTKEDWIDDSFAGQFDTYLYVDRDHVVEKIIECHESLRSERLQTYCESKEIDTKTIKVAVVIQKMVNSEVAGVGFSVHPVTQDRNTIIIEWALGLGEAVVSWSVTPDSYLIDKKSKIIKDKYISTQNKQLLRANDGGTEWIDIVPEQQTMQKLSDSHILLLADIIVRLEIFYGLPVDTEWALEKEKLYMTQSRPITTLDDIGEIGNDIFLPTDIANDLKATRNRYNKSYSGYLRGIFQQGMSIAYASRYIPEAMPYGIHIVNRDRKPHRDWFWNNDIFAQKRESILQQGKEDPSFFSAYLQEYEDLFDKYLKLISNHPLPVLLELPYIELSVILKNLYESYLPHAGRWYVADLFLSSDEKDRLEEKIEQSLGENSTEDIKSLLTAPTYDSFVHQAEIEKLKIAYRLKKGEEVVEDIQKFVTNRIRLQTNYRDYESLSYDAIYEECKLLSNSFQTLELLSQKLEEEIEAIQHNKERKEEIYNKLSIDKDLQLTISASEIFTHIQDSRKQGVLRTNYIFFHILEKLARELEIAKEYMFSITPEELWDLLLYKKIDRKLVEERYEKGCACVFFDNTYYLVVWKEIPLSFNLENFYPQLDKHTILKGTVAFHGQVQGTVRVVRNTTDIKAFQEWEILVANQTTPEYVSAIKKAIGIITDQGGITAHAAIVARELKKPCIIGTKIATQILEDGDIVYIDTYTNTITVIAKATTSYVMPDRLLSGDAELIASRPMVFQRDELLCSCYAQYIHIDRLSINIDGNNRSFYGNKKQIDVQYDKFFHQNLADKNNWISHKEEYQTLIAWLHTFQIEYEHLSKKTNLELAKYFQNRNSRLLQNWPYVVCPFVIERKVDPFVRELLFMNYGEELGKEYFSIASSPTEYTRYQRMRMDICTMKVAWAPYDISSLIRKYYRYSEYVFTENLLDEDYFHNELSKLTAEEAQEELEDIFHTLQTNKNNFQRMIKAIGNPEIIHRLDVINTYVFLRTDRVDLLKQGQVRIRNLYRIVAEKMQRAYEDILLLSNEEIVNFLLNEIIPSRTILSEREPSKYYFLYYGDEKHIVTDPSTIAQTASLLEKGSSSGNEITGIIAYIGTARGRVKKIYSREDIVKIQEGDILVARYTMIDYTPAMKLAAAFVTDEGGITSHAAIVARELQKPCLLWCKVAMRELEDNDLIEVDAYQWVVKIIKKYTDEDSWSVGIISELMSKIESIQRDVQRFNAYPLFISSVATLSWFNLPRWLQYRHFFCISHNHNIQRHYDIQDYEDIGNIFWQKITTPTQLKELITEYASLYNKAKENYTNLYKKFMNSIKENSHQLLQAIVEEMSLAAGYAHIIESASYIGEKRLLEKYWSTITIEPSSPSFLRQAQQYATEVLISYDTPQEAYKIFMEKYSRIKNTYLGITVISLEDFLALAHPQGVYEPISYQEDFLTILSLLFSRQDQRKANILESIERADKLLHSIAEKCSYDLSSLYFMLPEEVNKLWDSVYHQELLARKEVFVDYAPASLHRIKLIGEEAENFIISYNERKHSSSSTLQWNVAYKGKVTGKVRICLSMQSIKDFQEWEILVASMTRPEYIWAMKKALAFITDEGWITCHAAIVARELQKPCIIGTKLATHLLQDGDLVEADANIGIITLLQKPIHQDYSYFAPMDISYEAGRACYKIMNYLLNKGYAINNPPVEIPTDLGLITYVIGHHTKRYRYVDDVKRYELYLEKILQGEPILERTQESMIETGKKTRLYLHHQINLGLSLLSTEQFIQLYTTYFEDYAYMGFHSSILRLIDRGIITYINNYSSTNRDEILNLISTTTQYTHALQEEQALANIASLLVTGNYKVSDIFIQEKIENMVQQYAWIGLGYYNEQSKTFNDYYESLKNNPSLIIENYTTKKESFEYHLAQRTKRLQQQSEELQTIAHIASEAVWLKDCYKFSINRMQYDAEPLWVEASVRTGRTVEELKDLLPDEIISLLHHQSIDQTYLNQRQSSCIIYNKQQDLKVLVWEEAHYFFTHFIEKEEINKNTWKGRSACRGQITGPVRVILSPDDFYKVQQGDVLVVTNTSPDFVVLFDRIVGIIAEEGGITAHVSVVSREYGIPCIVWVHGITAQLKDEQQVLVDADSGEVSIIV
jgi:phosphoenolpyruvate synthase/pyruvate phosphate dikinase